MEEVLRYSSSAGVGARIGWVAFSNSGRSVYYPIGNLKSEEQRLRHCVTLFIHAWFSEIGKIVAPEIG